MEEHAGAVNKTGGNKELMLRDAIVFRAWFCHLRVMLN